MIPGTDEGWIIVSVNGAETKCSTGALFESENECEIPVRPENRHPLFARIPRKEKGKERIKGKIPTAGRSRIRRGDDF